MNGKHARIWILLSLVVAPLILAGIELFHPAHFTVNPGMSNFLSHPQPHDPQFNAVAYFGPHWWFIMHMIQTPLVVVIAFGMLLLTDTFDAPNPAARGMPVAWVSRLATVIFAIYFTVLDGIGGIGLGRQLIVLNELTDAVRESFDCFDLDGMEYKPHDVFQTVIVSLLERYGVITKTEGGWFKFKHRRQWRRRRRRTLNGLVGTERNER